MRRYYLISILFVSLTSQIYPQGPGEPFTPMTANGATGISRYGHILVWENPDSTVYNKVFFSDDSSLVNSLDTSIILVDGYPDSVVSSTSLSDFEPLEYFTKYYWRVVEYTGTDSTIGPVWYFRTRMNPTYPIFFFDDFENGLNNWIITNDGGTCIWDIFNS